MLVICLSVGASAARAKAEDKISAKDGRVEISIINVASPAEAFVRVAGRLPDDSGGVAVWEFPTAYAGADELDKRISKFALFDQSGKTIAARQTRAGRYEAERAAMTFEYEVKMSAPAHEPDAAHLSWLCETHGLLMLGDILPQTMMEARTVKVEIKAPAGWTVVSNEARDGDGIYTVADAAQSIFLIGRELREKSARVSDMNIRFAMAGDWAFTTEDAGQAAANILREHERVIGAMPSPRNVGARKNGDAMVLLAPFPRPVAAAQWSAETRGSTTLILSGRTPSKVAALAQLGTTLAHELFHLWIPNKLNLRGDYDWFYEGFTLYQAMRVAMRAGYLNFQDYLSALGRADDKYRQSRTRGNELSLVAASAQRWAGQSVYVYNKGMLVACLYDLELRRRSDGKLTLDDVYRALWRRYDANESAPEANRAVLDVLGGFERMNDVTRSYVENGGQIDLASALSPFGLNVAQTGARTQVTVAAKPDRRQSKLLRSFGYTEQEKVWHQRLKKAA